MKFSSWKMLIIALAVLWLQMAVMPALGWKGVTADLSLLFVALFAFLVDYHRVFWSAFLMGCLKDLLSDSFFGLETSSLVFGAIILSQITHRFDREDTAVQMSGIFLFSFATLVILMILKASVQESFAANIACLVQSFWIALYTTALAFLAFPAVRFFFRLKPYPKQYELF